MLSPSTALAMPGRKCAKPGLSRTPLPSVFTTVTVPRRQASVSPTTPSLDPGRRSNGSEKLASTRRITTSTGSKCPMERIHSRPRRMVRSAFSTNGTPSREASIAWSKAVSEWVPGVSTTIRGSSASVGATEASADRIVWKKAPRPRGALRWNRSGNTLETTRRSAMA